LVDANDGVGNRDPFRFDRVLVATVTKGATWDPGDRMVWSRVFVQPINFSFAGYTVAATENATIRVTSVEATTSRKFSGDIGLTIPGLEGPKADIGANNEHTLKTTSDINAEYERLGIDIKPDFLRIVRESETGGDVLGNTTIALSVLTDAEKILKGFPKDSENKERDDRFMLLVTNEVLDDQGVERTPEKAEIEVVPLTPLPHCPLLARVWMLFEQREIGNGRQYYDEGQQGVTLRRNAEVPRDIEIVSADDVSPAVWSIQIGPSDPKSGIEPSFLSAGVPSGTKRELVFTDYGLAVRLAHWMRTKQNATVSKLDFGNPANTSLVPVKKTGNECKPGTSPTGGKTLYQPKPGTG
jgi:hypothetical protein